MLFSKLQRRWCELSILLLLAGLTTPVFWLTDLDMRLAAWFYHPVAGSQDWPWREWGLWRFLFRYAGRFATLAAVSALAIALLSFRLEKLKPWRKPAFYVVLVIALGPGLVVNLVFKDHWGRPRPLHISQFGGAHSYIPPLQIGHTEEKSFPCGHCSVGYAFFAAYFLARRRKALYLALTLVFALMLALTRMTAGGHFLSDILWSGYLVFFVAWLLYYGWYARGMADA